MTAHHRRRDAGRRPAAPYAVAVCLAGTLLAGASGCAGEVTAGPEISSAAPARAPGATPLAGTLTGDAVPSEGSVPSAVGPAPSPASSGPVAEPEDDESPAAFSGPAAPDEEDLDVPDGATTATSEQQASGGPLSVVAVRSARHEGFDRVVLELAGEEAGEPGWYARYVDEPSQEASGTPLDVEGNAFLELSVRGTGYPDDTGQDELLGTVPGQGTDLMREVLVGGVFEGQAQVVVGLSGGEVPYVLTRLQDPPRLVLDLVG